jgi:hypothetical protein
MKWVTRSHVHVDRVACPWLIRRFIDNRAEFLFVPAGQVDRAASDEGAIPFDAPGVELGHRDGRCSFESILQAYDLAAPAGGDRARRRHLRRYRPTSAGTRAGGHCHRLQSVVP